MHSRWNSADAEQFVGPLGQRVYTSRLLGQDHSLVLHGGGNTSVKVRERNIFGEEHEILYVKGSGWDLETIEPAGFAPVRLETVLRLASLPSLSDPEMVQELRAAMTNPGAPTPSVETLLHAVLPYRFVDHTHADALLAITNTSHDAEQVRQIYGEAVVVVPYVMPGFDLARVVAEQFPREATPNVIGLVLLNHGFFSFGETARESYERMMDLVSRAENFLAKHATYSQPKASPASFARQTVAALRHEVSTVAGFPLLVSTYQGAKELAFAQRSDVDTISQQGPATPDHVIRTKRVPQLGREVAAFKRAYVAYFEEHSARAKQPLTMLDPAPRVILDPELGLLTFGRTAQEADIAFDVYAHTIDIILQATALGGYRALPASDIFAVEYWDLEQAKLRRAGQSARVRG